jgi:putative transposase
MVWVPKYRKLLLKGGLAKRLKGVFHEIAKRDEFEIDTMEMNEDHVHLFLTAPPRYSSSQIVGIMKSISAKVVFRYFRKVRNSFGVGSYGVMDILSGLLETRLPLK